jgi:hypothetical protein
VLFILLFIDCIKIITNEISEKKEELIDSFHKEYKKELDAGHISDPTDPANPVYVALKEKAERGVKKLREESHNLEEARYKVNKHIRYAKDPDNDSRFLLMIFPSIILYTLYFAALFNPATIAAMGGFTFVYITHLFLAMTPGIAGGILSYKLVDVILPIREWRNVGLHKPKITETSLIKLFVTMNDIIFSVENKVPVTAVKNKLKYWGLLQSQVDYIFTSGQMMEGKEKDGEFVKNYFIDIIKLCVYSNNNKDFTIAPNESLNQDQLEAVYPKPELLHKNNVLQGGVTRRKNRKHK